jgi:hypothetical protein
MSEFTSIVLPNVSQEVNESKEIYEKRKKFIEYLISHQKMNDVDSVMMLGYCYKNRLQYDVQYHENIEKIMNQYETND